MRRCAGALRHGRALRRLIGFSTLVVFLAMHLASCSIAVGQSRPHEHQPAAHATESGHGTSPSPAGGDCDHEQHDEHAGDMCLAPMRPSQPVAAGFIALPADLKAQSETAADVDDREGRSGDEEAPGKPWAGRHLLVSVGVART